MMNMTLESHPTVHEAPGEVGLLPEGRRADVRHRGRPRLPGLLQVRPVPPLVHPGQSSRFTHSLASVILGSEWSYG